MIKRSLHFRTYTQHLVVLLVILIINDTSFRTRQGPFLLTCQLYYASRRAVSQDKEDKPRFSHVEPCVQRRLLWLFLERFSIFSPCSLSDLTRKIQESLLLVFTFHQRWTFLEVFLPAIKNVAILWPRCLHFLGDFVCQLWQQFGLPVCVRCVNIGPKRGCARL